ncbi:hypothetical protein T10_431 [Trichinella papuae]|uniref:Uncharacterized protein n=1 Tax=Trichinella papuae TaxID=268474 RepID=A0A0V1MP80_9BILA|nr:hypothetical protein T10_431 [Trichinella papuae]
MNSVILLAFSLEQSMIKYADFRPRSNARRKIINGSLTSSQRSLRFALLQRLSRCELCKGDNRCPRFLFYSVHQVRYWIMSLKLCFVCLSQGHRRENCLKRKSNPVQEVGVDLSTSNFLDMKLTRCCQIYT